MPALVEGYSAKAGSQQSDGLAASENEREQGSQMSNRRQTDSVLTA
jgi:hypothetical protein